MRTTLTCAFVLLASCTLWAADTIQPLAAKTGEWEITRVTENSGMPPIPAEALAKMTAEQRARIEAAMKARQGTHNDVTKVCVTEEQLKKSFNLGMDQKDCKHQIVTSSSSKQEVQFECSTNGMNQKGSFVVEAQGGDRIQGTVQMSASGNGHTMNINSTFTGKWLGATCTEKNK